ncbi:MAG: hypothetical protein ACP5J8_02400 [Minisyncoccia bacterium]
MLIQYGGSVAIIIALIYLIRELNIMSKNKNNNNIIERIEDLEKIKTNDLVHLESAVDNLQNQVSDLNARVSAIETALKMKKIIR